MTDLIILLIIIVLVSFLSRYKVNLGVSLMLATIFLGITSGFTPLKIFQSIFNSCISLNNLKLIFTLLSVLFLSYLFTSADVFNKIVRNLESILRDSRWIMAIIPAVVGFLPMMGGALISAPVVGEISKKINISNEKKVFINYWFRHIWEYTLPIYPGILVAANILRIPIFKVIIYNLIFTVSAIVLGLIFGINRVPKTLSSKTTVCLSKTKGIIYFLFNLSPILLIMILILGVKLDVVYSLITGIIYALITCRINLRTIFGFRLKSEHNLLLLALSILIFKDMLENCGIIERLPVVFNTLGISRYLVIALLPFIVGLLTGLTVAAIGVSFPVLVPLIGNDLTLMALGYMCGYAGVLLTPVHLCLSLTKEYFHAEWKKIYLNELVIPVIIMLLIAFIYALI